MDQINKKKILDILNKQKINISDCSFLKEDLGLDSISIVQVLTQICHEFKIDILSISDFDLIQLKTVNDLINLIMIKDGI